MPTKPHWGLLLSVAAMWNISHMHLSEIHGIVKHNFESRPAPLLGLWQPSGVAQSLTRELPVRKRFEKLLRFQRDCLSSLYHCEGNRSILAASTTFSFKKTPDVQRA